MHQSYANVAIPLKTLSTAPNRRHLWCSSCLYTMIFRSVLSAISVKLEGRWRGSNPNFFFFPRLPENRLRLGLGFQKSSKVQFSCQRWAKVYTVLLTKKTHPPSPLPHPLQCRSPSSLRLVLILLLFPCGAPFRTHAGLWITPGRRRSSRNFPRAGRRRHVLGVRFQERRRGGARSTEDETGKRYFFQVFPLCCSCCGQ